MTNILIDAKRPAHDVSRRLYGIFIEDINFAADGGLNANLVNNFSFDGVYFDKKAKKDVSDPLRYWKTESVVLTAMRKDGLSEKTGYARVAVNGTGKLINLGYNGGKAHKDEGAMAIQEGHDYAFSCMLRGPFEGTITIYLEDDQGNALTEKAVLSSVDSEWTPCEVEVKPIAEGYGRLVLRIAGTGSFDLDLVKFMDQDTWNRDDPKYKYTKLRKDLVQALYDLNPSFVRFPGGSIVGGFWAGNEYNWKHSVGPLEERQAIGNMWGRTMPDGGYSQSYQVGFYEYFCLCEDLGAEPQPTLFPGITCQVPKGEEIKTDSKEFKEYVIDNYLDLIDFANGDPTQSPWARLRADMGHPAPFNLRRIGIGNESFGASYVEKFDAIRRAIREKDPNMEVIISAGYFPFAPFTKRYWKYAEKLEESIYVDEHCYHSTDWFYKAEKRFDKLPRGKAKLYFGEYSANGMMAMKKITPATSNYYETCLAEAAFLTGVERNSDYVAMTSYAPLFNLVDSDQWAHNLIDFNPRTHVRTVNYQVQRLFSSFLGKEYIPYEGTLPEKVFLSATAEDNQIIVKLVNASDTTEVVALQLPGVPDGCVQVDLIQSDDMHARNTISFTSEPVISVPIMKADCEIKQGTLNYTAEKQSVQVLRFQR